MIKVIIFYLILLTNLFSKDCADYFNPSKFYESPMYLQELINENILEKNLEFFGDEKNYKKLDFNFYNKKYINDNFTLNEYSYPKYNGIFEYKVSNNVIKEFSIAKVEFYTYTQFEIANSINNFFEEYWHDWEENAYEMKLLPEQTLFKYKDKYFGFSVFIYGVDGDSTKLKTTVIKYVFKDFTKEVFKNIKCNNK